MRTVAVLVALAWPMFAQADRFYVSGGVSYIQPNFDGHNFQLEPTGLAALAGPMMPVTGNLTTDSITTVSAILGVNVYHRFAVETIVALPMSVHLHANGMLADQSLAPTAFGFPTGIPPLGHDLGEADAISPVVTAVYRIADVGLFTPYVGAGATVMFIENARVTNPVLTGAGEPQLNFSPAVGGVLQGGLEARIWENWSARVDLKYMVFADQQASIDNISVKTTIPFIPTMQVGSAKVDVSASPVVVQAGVGATF